MDNMNLDICREKMPETIEGLCNFILYGTENLALIKAHIRALENLGVADEIRNQAIQRYMEDFEILLEAEIKLGELLYKLPKAKPKKKRKGQVQELFPPEYTKRDALEELGLKKDQAYRFELLAEYKEVVQKLFEEEKNQNRLPSKTKILRCIRKIKNQDQPEKERKSKEPEPELEPIDSGTVTLAGIYKTFHEATHGLEYIKLTEDYLDGLAQCFTTELSIQSAKSTMVKVKQNVMILEEFFKELKMSGKY